MLIIGILYVDSDLLLCRVFFPPYTPFIVFGLCIQDFQHQANWAIFFWDPQLSLEHLHVYFTLVYCTVHARTVHCMCMMNNLALLHDHTVESWSTVVLPSDLTGSTESIG